MRLRHAAAVLALQLAAVSWCAAPAAAQGPAAAWRTTGTASFRVHYPEEFESWALHMAARLESIRARISEEVGYVPEVRTDVLVMDPFATPNAMAIVLLRSPRMILWTTPAPADSLGGHYGDWAELLMVHEDAHLVHLLRPSRNPVQQIVRHVLPLGPITLRAPRWLIEGYATVLEGDLTGLGRPHSDLRAATLRRLAQLGRLPAYGQLSGEPGEWLGGAMPYLAGSAFLEWLRARGGPESFRHLWARMTARTDRTFEAAFEGVYGAAPHELYGRFAASLTHEALEVERALEPTIREGELWQRPEWTTGAPALSPDGARLALVARHRDRPSRLVIWDTGPPEEETRRWQEEIERTLARDPEDVPPVRERPLPRRTRHELPTVNGAEPRDPRWMPDGESLLFSRLDRRPDGTLGFDLFRWFPGTGQVRRVTRRADVRLPDPAPDGQWAVAVRHRHGYSQLVRVDLASVRIDALTEPDVSVAYDRPRIAPDGRRLLFLRNSGEGWRAVVRPIAAAGGIELALPEGATVASPAWSPDGAMVYLSVGVNGLVDIWRMASNGSAAGQAITRVRGAALAPEPAPDGEALFFLALEPHGFDVRRLPDPIPLADAPGLPRPSLIVRPAPPAPPVWALEEVPPGRGYGIGRPELMPLVGGTVAPSARAFEAGVRLGDLLGRFDLLVLGSLSRERAGPRGAAAVAAWRGWPVTLGVHAFSAEIHPSAQPVDVPGLGDRLDAGRRGVEVSAAWERVALARRLSARAALLTGEVDAFGLRQGSIQAGYGLKPSRGRWFLRHAATADLDRGRTGGNDWTRRGLILSAGGGIGAAGLSATWERRGISGSPGPFDRFQVGGLPGSLLPASARAAQVPVAALPAATLVGDQYERQRLEVGSLFLERHRTWQAGGTRGDWLRLAGFEVSGSPGPLPIVRLPAPRVSLGLARIFDAPYEDTTRFWFGLAWGL